MNCKRAGTFVLSIITSTIFLTFFNLIVWGIGISNEGFNSPPTFEYSLRYTFLFTVLPLSAVAIPCLLMYCLIYRDTSIVFRTSPFFNIYGVIATCIFYGFVFLTYFLLASLVNLSFPIYKDSNITSFEQHFKVTATSVIFANTFAIMVMFTANLVKCTPEVQEEIVNNQQPV